MGWYLLSLADQPLERGVRVGSNEWDVPCTSRAKPGGSAGPSVGQTEPEAWGLRRPWGATCSLRSLWVERGPGAARPHQVSGSHQGWPNGAVCPPKVGFPSAPARPATLGLLGPGRSLTLCCVPWNEEPGLDRQRVRDSGGLEQPVFSCLCWQNLSGNFFPQQLWA